MWPGHEQGGLWAPASLSWQPLLPASSPQALHSFRGPPHPLLSTPVTPIPVSLQQNLSLMRSLSEGCAAQTTLLKHEHWRQGWKDDPRADGSQGTHAGDWAHGMQGELAVSLTFSLTYVTLSCLKFSLNFSLKANMYFYFLINLVWLDFRPM